MLEDVLMFPGHGEHPEGEGWPPQGYGGFGGYGETIRQ